MKDFIVKYGHIPFVFLIWVSMGCRSIEDKGDKHENIDKAEERTD